MDRAIATFSQSLVVKLTEDNYLKLSLRLEDQGKETEARSQLDEAVKANPDYADAQELIKLLNTSKR